MSKRIKKFYLDSLSNCNEDCLFCTKKGEERPQGNLNTRKCKEEIEKAAREDYRELHFDGGEPTLRNDLPELIQFAEKSGFKKICILTNALKFSEKTFAEEIINSFQKTQPTFSVSLHSHKKETSEYLVNTLHTFGKTIGGVQNLINLGAYVFLYHIITRQNYQDLSDFVKYISRNFPEIKHIIFSFIYPAGAALRNRHIFPKLSKVEPHLLRTLKLCKEKDISFNIASCGMVPLCFFKGYEQYPILQQIVDQPENIKLINEDTETQYQLATEEFHRKTKIKPKQCNLCLLDNFCPGLWEVYAKSYGTEELKPVRDRKRLEKIKQAFGNGNLKLTS